MPKPTYIFDDYGYIENFVANLNNYNFSELTGDLPNILFAPDQPQQIPKIKHFNWIGSALISAKDWHVIKNFAEMNQDFVAILWMSFDLNSDDPIIQQLIAEANTYKINLIDYRYALNYLTQRNDEFFLDNLPYIIGNLIIQRKYVQAADIFRVITLYLFGGVYTDLDLTLVKPIDENFLASSYGLKVNKDFSDKYTDYARHVLFEFDVIAAKANHPDLLEWLGYLVDAAEKPYSHIFNKDNRPNTCNDFIKLYVHNYDKEYAYQNYKYVEATLCKTGPLLDELFPTIAVRSEKVPEEYFEDVCNHCADWADPKTYSKTSKEIVAVDEAITAILNELYLEPRILKLNMIYLCPAWMGVARPAEFYRNILKKLVTDESLRTKLDKVEKICYPMDFAFDLVLLSDNYSTNNLPKTLPDKTIFLQLDNEAKYLNLPHPKAIAHFKRFGLNVEKIIDLVGVDLKELPFPSDVDSTLSINLAGNENLVKTIAMLSGCSDDVYFFTPEIVRLVFGKNSPFKSLALTQYFLSPGLFDLDSTKELLKYAIFKNELNSQYEQLKPMYDKYGTTISEHLFIKHKKILKLLS